MVTGGAKGSATVRSVALMGQSCERKALASGVCLNVVSHAVGDDRATIIPALVVVRAASLHFDCFGFVVDTRSGRPRDRIVRATGFFSRSEKRLRSC